MKKSREVSTVVELPESILEWVESRSQALNTTPEKLIVAAIALAKKRDEEGGAR
jgi:hypothetical protein